MAPHIISWSDREICISPVLSSAASTISFDSTFSDPIPSHSPMSPTASEALGLPGDKFGARYNNLPGFSDEGRTSRGGHATLNDSFVRHDVYFFKDGNVTFLIDGTLYCVHRYFFSRDSIYFSTRFAQLGIRDHEALPVIISIDDVERDDFEALLSILYPADFESQELTYEQWKSVLHLSTRWDFASLRKLALKSIRPPTSHDQLVLARTYSVEEQALPALTALCSRSLPLSLDEARQMDIEDVILVASVREEIRDGALRVDVADIPHRVEAARAGKLNRLVGDKAKAEAKDKATRGAGAKAQAEAKAEAKKKREVNSIAKVEANAIVKANALADADARMTADADAWAKEEAGAIAEAAAGAEAEAARAEKEKEARKRAEAEELREEQIAKQRAADKAAKARARERAAASSGSRNPFRR